MDDIETLRHERLLDTLDSIEAELEMLREEQRLRGDAQLEELRKITALLEKIYLRTR